jgi:hypothetical protein
MYDESRISSQQDGVVPGQHSTGEWVQWRQQAVRLQPLETSLALLPIGAGTDLKGPVDPNTGNGLSNWQKSLGYTITQLLEMNGPVRAIGARTGPLTGPLLAFDFDGATAITLAIAEGCDPAAVSTWQVHRTTDQYRFKVLFSPTAAQIALLPIDTFEYSEITKAAVKGVAKAEALEVFCQGGRQVVILGEHPSSGGLYFWPEGCGPEALAPLPEAWLQLAVRWSQKALEGSARSAAVTRGNGPRNRTTGRLNPCPICGRHDGLNASGQRSALWCEQTDKGLIFCMPGSTFSAVQAHGVLKVSSVVKGSDGNDWAVKKIVRITEGDVHVFGIDQPREPQPAAGPTWDPNAPIDDLLGPPPVATKSAAGAPPPGNDPKQVLKLLLSMAKQLLQDKVPHHSRMPLLRAAGVENNLMLRDGELLAICATARQELKGQSHGFTADDEFDIPDETWSWEQIIAATTINLIVALQKVGKTALVAGLIAAWCNGEPEFLGHRFAGPCPPVIIAGTDQTIADWRSVLAPVGLMEKKPNGKWRVCGPIVKLWHRGAPVYLTGEGIEDIAAVCEQHPGAVLLCDTYAALVAPLGLDEAKPEAAEPLYNLAESIDAFGITTLLIHHSSKSRANERASNASRNSNAIPAAASQIISLQWLEPDKKNDQRIALTTEGRNSRPVELIIEQVERSQWTSHGTAADIREQQRLHDAESNLSPRQAFALQEVRTLWERDQQEMDAIALSCLDPEDLDPRKARSTLHQLADKGLLDKRTDTDPERGGTVVLFRPQGSGPLLAHAHGGIQNHPPQPPQPPQVPKASQPCTPPPLVTSFSAEEPAEAAEGPYEAPRAHEADSPTPAAASAATPQIPWLPLAQALRAQGLTPHSIALQLDLDGFHGLDGRAVKNALEMAKLAP